MSLSGQDALLRWCQRMAGGYPGIGQINSFKTPFRDGLIFCAILCSYDKNCIDYSSLKTGSDDHVVRNNGIAFKVAEERFKIEPLLDAEDMAAMSVPDAKSITTYVSQMYKFLKELEGNNPYYRDYERQQEEAERKKMEEAMLAKKAANTPPPPKPIQRGTQLSDPGADGDLPEGPCNQCILDRSYPECKQYQAPAFKGKSCRECPHTMEQHRGSASSDAVAARAAVAAERKTAGPADDEKAAARKKALKAEADEWDRMEAEKMGSHIEKAANDLTDFLTPKTPAKRLDDVPTGKAPKGGCLRCKKEMAFPACTKYEASAVRKGQCVGCLHAAGDHEQEQSAATADTPVSRSKESPPADAPKQRVRESATTSCPRSELVTPAAAPFSVKKVYESLIAIDNAYLLLDPLSKDADKLLADLTALRPKLEDQAQKNPDEMEQAVARFRVLNRELPEKTNSARGAANNSAAVAAVKNCAVCKAKLTGKAVDFEGRSFHKGCFTCFGCGAPLGSEQVIALDHQPHCDKCGRTAFASSTNAKSAPSISSGGGSGSNEDVAAAQRARQKARAARRKELVAQGLALGIIPPLRDAADMSSRMQTLRMDMLARKQRRVAHTPSATNATSSAPVERDHDDHRDRRDREQREREEREERERNDHAERERDRERERREKREREEREASQQREREERDAAERKERDRAEAARRAEQEGAAAREEREKREREEDEARRARQAERERKEREEEAEQEAERARAAEARRRRMEEAEREAEAEERERQKRRDADEAERNARDERERAERAADEKRYREREAAREAEERQREEADRVARVQREEDDRRQLEAAAREREREAEHAKEREAALAALPREVETTVDLDEKDPEVLLAALEAKGDELSHAEKRAKIRAKGAIERKLEEARVEAEMEERRRQREARRKAREEENQ